jgi:uncharacterized membrane protein YvbJ
MGYEGEAMPSHIYGSYRPGSYAIKKKKKKKIVNVK